MASRSEGDKMGKVSPPSIKYIIKADFSAEGVVETPDVIGAIFGQTEGLLGDELELRELQKQGKIGRITADLNTSESKTTGLIEIPTSINKAETAIIAAAIETIDRIGPCDAKFEIKDIEDVRTSKREFIMERAKKLMENLSTSSPELREMEQKINAHTKTSKIKEYGRELLAAGPDIETSSEIVVVEGRADVLSLLRAGIKNGIAMNGTVIPETVKKLSQEKQVILFLDGDRGGILIAQDAIANARVAAIARAPDGKEVEELTEKEIISCLRNKMSVNDFKDKYMNGKKPREREDRYERPRERFERPERRYERPRQEYVKIERVNLTDEVIEKNMSMFQDLLEDLNGTKSAFLLGLQDSEFKILQRVSLTELSRAMQNARRRGQDVTAIVMNATVTPFVIKIVERYECQAIVARNFAATSQFVRLISL